jgi:uncharacterized protein
MYLVGGPHRHKADAQRLLEGCIAAGERLVTDVEVLAEILHRFVAIERRDAVLPCLAGVLGVVDEVFPVEQVDVERAAGIVLGRLRLSARDALHLAVMERRGVSRIMSFDAGLDGHPGIRRIH